MSRNREHNIKVLENYKMTGEPNSGVKLSTSASSSTDRPQAKAKQQKQGRKEMLMTL